MRRLKIPVVSLLPWALAAGLAMAAPPVFPEVVLAETSDPHYAALALDPFTNRVAYVLLDGDVKSGYEKMHVWIPGDKQYGDPVVMRAGEGNRFPPLTIASQAGEEAASVSWRIAWSRQTSGGTHQYFDYLTGRTVTSQSPEVTSVYFGFVVGLRRGVDLERRQRGPAPVDIEVSGWLPTARTPTNLPAPFGPWNQLHFYFIPKPIPGEEKEGVLQVTGRLHYQNIPCQVRSLPEETEIGLTIAPYLQSPIYDKTVDREAIFREGIDVALPWGWYEITGSFQCPWLVASTPWPRQSRPQPYPFAPLASRR